MRKNPYFNVVFLLALVVLFPTKPAHAYLDPGTGSYAIQVGIAAVFAVIYGIRLWWSNVLGFFKKLFVRKTDAS